MRIWLAAPESIGIMHVGTSANASLWPQLYHTLVTAIVHYIM